MSTPIVIHVLRPYANEDEYLALEHTSMDGKSMLLIDQPPLPADTAIVFDVQLANGHKPIRAEAKVIAHVAAQGADPGGLRVRFKRFGSMTKAFIDRAVALGGTSGAASLMPPGPPVLVQSLAPSATTSAPSLLPSPASALPSPSFERKAAPDSRPSLPGDGEALDPQDASGIHRKSLAPLAAPANREALLARLRRRLAS